MDFDTGRISHTPSPVQHAKVAEFINVVREAWAVGNPSSSGQVIPDTIAALMHSLAFGIEQRIAGGGALNLQLVNAVLVENAQRPLRGEAEQQIGHYSAIHKFTVNDGAGGENQAYIVFAFIPEGHAAPKHTHRSPKGLNLPGEITVTLKGILSWQEQEGGAIETHTASDMVRVSPEGSKDLYLQQKSAWLGLYVQFKSCDLL
jgi:hypothetical protein